MTEPTTTAVEAPPPAQQLAPAPPRRELSTDTAPVNYFNDLRSFEIGQRQALMLSKTSILPNAYRQQYEEKKNGQMVWVDNPDAVGNCFIALELAQRLNVSPLVVMQQVDMIHGRPGLRGTFLAGLINGSGRFTELDYECNGLSGDEYGWRVSSTRLSDGKLCIGPWVTWKMVKLEKWQDKTGSKWMSMPELMFQYRSCSFWSRLFASHITLGLQTNEELREVFGEPDQTRGRLTSDRDNRPVGDGGAGGLADLERQVLSDMAGMKKPDAPGDTPADEVVDEPAPPVATENTGETPRETDAAGGSAAATAEPEAVQGRPRRGRATAPAASPAPDTATAVAPEDLFRAE